MYNEGKVQINIRVTKELKDYILQESKKQGLSMQQYIEHLFIDYFGSYIVNEVETDG